MDCGGPPALGSGSTFTAGDGLTATSGGNGFSLLDSANTSGSAATLFPNGLTVGASGTCGLSYNGGGCFTGPSSIEVDLKFGTSLGYQFQSGTQTVNNTSSSSTLTLGRLDSTLASGATVGQVSFTGKDASGASQSWGLLNCSVGATSSSSTMTDAGICRLYANSAGSLTELLDFNGAPSGSTPNITALQPLVLTQPLTPPSAGDNEVNHYVPIEAPGTNLLLQTGNLCLTGVWICSTNMTSALNASNMPTSPDGSKDMLLLYNGGTSGLTKQNITLASSANIPYTFFDVLESLGSFRGHGRNSVGCVDGVQQRNDRCDLQLLLYDIDGGH